MLRRTARFYEPPLNLELWEDIQVFREAPAADGLDRMADILHIPVPDCRAPTFAQAERVPGYLPT